MQYRITECPVSYLPVQAILGPEHATVEAAIAWIEANLGPVLFHEADADHPGCHDLFVSPGRVVAIEPVTE